MTTLNAIRTITIRSKTEGVPESTAALKGLTAAQDGVARSAAQTATVTDMASKRQLSAADAYRKQTLQLDQNAKMQDRIARATLVADRALQQGLITQRDHAQRLTLISERYKVGTEGANAFGRAVAAANDNIRGFAGSAGQVASILTSLGPAGLAAAAAIAVLTLGLAKAHQEAGRFAVEMGKIRDIAETTGLNTGQFQAIADLGAQFALSEERIGQVLQRFAGQMDEVRRAQGELFDLVRRIDEPLAQELRRTRDLSEALDVLAKVYDKAGESRAKLDRLIAGRGGGTFGLLIQELGRQGGVSNLTNEFKKTGDAIDDALIKKITLLKREIDDMAEDARRNFASLFSVELLEQEKAFTSGVRDLSRLMREFKTSGDWREFVTKLSDQGFIAGLQKLAAGIPLIGGLISSAAGLGAAAVRLTNPPKPAGANAGDLMFGGGSSQFSAAGLGGLSQKDYRAELEATINLERERLQVLGDSATVAQRLEQRERELKLALTDNKITLEEYNRALRDAREHMAAQALNARISALGDLSTTQEIVAAKQNAINEANDRGAKITKEETAAILAKTAALHEFSKLPNQLQFERAQIGRTDIEQQVASRLRQEGMKYEEHMNGATAEMIRQNAIMEKTKTVMQDAASGFVNDLARGVDLMTALSNLAAKVGQTFIDMATKNMVSGLFSGIVGGQTGGSVGGGQVVMQTGGFPSIGTWDTNLNDRFNAAFGGAAKILKEGVNDASSSFAGSVDESGTGFVDSSNVAGNTIVSAGGSVANTLVAALSGGGSGAAQAGGGGGGGLLAGIFGGGMGGNLAALGIGVGISLISGMIQKKEQAKKEAEQASATWNAMHSDFMGFLDKMAGAMKGPFSSAVDAARREMQQFVDAAAKAKDFGAVAQAQQAFNEFREDQARRFFSTMEMMANAYAENDRVLIDAVAGINDYTDAVRGFIGDTKEFGKLFLDAETAAAHLARAQEAARQFALGALDLEPALSDVARQTREFEGRAQALVPILIELGMTAEQAGAAVQEHLVNTLQQLQAAAEDTLMDQINENMGLGWINNINDILAEFNQMSAEGIVDAGLLHTWLTTSLQAVVDQAQLTGAAFDQLVSGMPQLIGLIHEFSDVVVMSAQEIAAQLQSLEDRLFAATNDTSTLAGALAAFDRAAALERLTIAVENLALFEQVIAAERLNIIQQFHQQVIEEERRAAEERERILEEARNFLQGIARRISEYIAGLLGGSQSPLSPQQRLQEAQTAFNQQLALAQAGDRDALSGITQFHSTLIEAAKAFYGSSTAFQNIFDTSLAQLEALPSQVSAEQLIVDAIENQTSALSSFMGAWFAQLDTNTDGLLSQAEFVTGLHGMASDTALQALFQTLDTDNSGNLQANEWAAFNVSPFLINNTQSTAVNSGTTATNAGATASNVAAGTAVLNAILAIQQSSQGILDNIYTAYVTALGPQVTSDPSNAAPTTVFGTSNTLIEALNKIVSNTFATAQNTATIVAHTWPGSGTYTQFFGRLAEGGVIPPGGLALVSEHSPGGGRFIRAGAEPITVSPYMPANDNVELLDEVRALRSDNNRLTRALIEVLDRSGTGTIEALAAVNASQKSTERAIERHGKPQPSIRRARAS